MSMRTLVFIENDIYSRNFAQAGAFDLLSDYGCALSEPGPHFDKLRDQVPSVVGEYHRHYGNIQLLRYANKIMSLALADESSTFRIKAETSWLGSYSAQEYCLASTKHPDVLRESFARRFEPNESLRAIIREHSPQLVIFPVTGVEATGTELVLLSQDYGFRTLFLVNGWDNLCSKGVFLRLPDYLGVWGQQSLVDAVQIQGMPQHRCILMGCSRYEPYFTMHANCLNSPFRFPYILFAGATTPCDEIGALKICERLLAGSAIKVVYRPHPWREKRKCFDLFEKDGYNNVVIDPQVEEAYYGEKAKGTESVSSGNYPSLDYYPALLNHAMFIVSPMSSMTLEAALFDVPALILANDDGVHSIPASKQLEYHHFKGYEDMPGWVVAKTMAEFRLGFDGALIRWADESRDHRKFRPALSLATRRYLHQDGRTYAERLRDAVATILAK